MKKKIMMISSIVSVSALLVSLVSYISNNVDNKNSFKNISKKTDTIAMYIENDDGDFVPSTDSTFPTDGYILNIERSSCINGGVLSQNPETKSISLSVSNTDSCTLYFEKEKKKSSGDEIIAKSNDETIITYNDGNKTEMYTFSHEATEQTPAQTDYRYIGNTPNNYVTFNNETWRIIGVFETENSSGTMEQRIKIMRPKSLGNIAWDSSSKNEWSTASLQKLLNGDYYNRTGSYSSTGLTLEARAMIEPAKWYLGGFSTFSGLGGPNYYNFERGTTVPSGQTTSFIENVGLIYPSDYIYTYAYGVDNTCYTNGYYCRNGTPSAGWMYIVLGGNRWTLSRLSDGSNRVLYFCSDVDYTYATDPDAVHPVVYLKPGIKLVDGDGSQGNPYTLG